jgi:hypothetical protein
LSFCLINNDTKENVGRIAATLNGHRWRPI